MFRLNFIFTTVRNVIFFSFFLFSLLLLSAEQQNKLELIVDKSNFKDVSLPLKIDNNLPIRVSGKILADGQVELNPIQRLTEQHQNTKDKDGEYQLKIVDQNNIQKTLSFKPVIALGAEQENWSGSFSLIIANINFIKSLQINKNGMKQLIKVAGVNILSKQYLNVKDSKNINYHKLMLKENSKQIKIQWNNIKFPWMQLIFRDNSSSTENKFKVISLNSVGGNVVFNKSELEKIDGEGEWIISLSNGINSLAFRAQR